MTGAPPRRFPPFPPHGRSPERAPLLAPSEGVRRLLADPELLAHLSDVVAVLDEDLYFVYVSRSVTRPLTSLVGHSMLDVLAPHERGRVRDACMHTLGTGLPQPLLASDTDGRWWESRIARGYDGERPMLIMTTCEVTERISAERQRHEQESRLRAASEATGVGTFSWDLERNELLWDAALFRILGRDPTRPPDGYVDYLDYVHPEDRTRVARQVELILVTGVFDEFEHRLLRPDGELRHVVCRGTVLRHADGRVHSIRGGVVDVTIRERLDAKLRHVQKMEAVGQLTAGIAHNFNNLLSVALPNLELCRARAPEAMQRPLADVLHAVTRASELVRQLMRFARQEPPTERERAPLDLAVVAHRTAQICSATFGSGIEVALALAEALPSVRARAGDIEQVLLNVCINARDALLEADTPSPRIAIAVAEVEGGAAVRVTITDNGPGCDETVRARMFEPFFTTKEVHRGTGLGLATAYAIVIDHQGSIRCESEPGAGCSFLIELPVHTRDVAEPSASSPARAAATRERVLLIDDEAPVRRALRAVLEGHGFEVLEASDGAAGLALLDDHAAVDAIVLDRSMPQLSGDAFLAALPRVPRRVPVLLLTGHAGDEGERTEHADVAAVLLKPVRASELLRSIRRAIDDSAVALRTGAAQ